MKIEACRAFSWKAAHYLDQYDSEGHAVGAMAKVFCGETLFNAVFRTMQAMGVNSLDKKHPVEKFLREAAVFPLYDAGNIGMQMRKIWGVMLDPEFDPRAIADSRPMKFKKSMEGVGTLVSVDESTPVDAQKSNAETENPTTRTECQLKFSVSLPARSGGMRC